MIKSSEVNASSWQTWQNSSLEIYLAENIRDFLDSKFIFERINSSSTAKFGVVVENTWLLYSKNQLILSDHSGHEYVSPLTSEEYYFKNPKKHAKLFWEKFNLKNEERLYQVFLNYSPYTNITSILDVKKEQTPIFEQQKEPAICEFNFFFPSAIPAYR